MKELVIVLDGLEDVAYPELGGKTPFDHAGCVHIARLRQSKYVVRAVEGRETDSQTCILRLLGVEKENIPTGRAYLEALSQNIPVDTDDLLLRLNGVELDENGRIVGSCSLDRFDFCEGDAASGMANRSSKTFTSCVAENGVEAFAVSARRRHMFSAFGITHLSSCGYPVYRLSGYRGIMRIPGGKNDREGLLTFAPHKHIGQSIDCVLPRGNALADELSRFSKVFLQSMSRYTVIPWSPSLPCQIPRPDGYDRSVFVCCADIVRGIAKAMDIDCVTPSGATGDVDTDLEEKCAVSLRLLDSYETVLLHINGTDEASHRQNPFEKSAFISKIDKLVVGPVMEKIPKGVMVTITSDHATLCKDGKHSAMPVREWSRPGRCVCESVADRGRDETQ